MNKKLIVTPYQDPELKKQWPLKFKVKFEEGKEEYFSTYPKALKYFNSLQTPAALWQVDGMPELLLLKEWEK